MSSCRSCGSCPKFFPTPSGRCDYCDCPSTDHGGQVPQMQSQMSMPALQQPMFSPTQDMRYAQQQFIMPQQYLAQPNFQQPPQFVPMTTPQPFMPHLQYNPNMNQFPQYNSPQPYGTMPMMPPNQLTQPYVASRSCTKCGVILPGANKATMCMTCLKDKPPSLCTKCATNKANAGFSWCQTCFESDDKCRKCGKTQPNEGYKWCETCYQAQDNPIDCFPQEVAVNPKELCPCGNPKFYNMKEKKLFDFCGQTCAQQHYTAYGVLKLDSAHSDFILVSTNFRNNWNVNKGACPPITAVYKVRPDGTEAKFHQYVQTLRDTARAIEYYFHGCKLTCDLLNTNKLCNLADCTICLVTRQGFDITKVGTNVPFNRFGKGLYFAPESSKCHDYTLGVAQYGYRAMLFVKCAPGFKQIQFTDNQNRVAPDEGYNSLYGHAGKNLNYDELCLYNDHACVPEYIIIYNRDGVGRRCH